MRRLFLCTVSSMLLAGGLPEELPLRTTLRAETLRLPQNEALGLIGFSGTASFGPWYLGPGLYGAARGQRGGFFTFGQEGGGRGRPFPSLPLELEGGVFVGGGGGASAPQGGGLMLRPHLGAAFVLGAARLGLELSRVTFPNGGIDSTQVALTLAFTSQGLWMPEAASRQSFEGPVRWGERSLEPELIRVEATSASRTRTGTSQAPLTLAGLTSARDLGGPWFSYLAADGAAGGSSAGYAQALGGLGLRLPLPGPRGLEARLVAGLGGGATSTPAAASWSQERAPSPWAPAPGVAWPESGFCGPLAARSPAAQQPSGYPIASPQPAPGQGGNPWPPSISTAGGSARASSSTARPDAPPEPPVTSSSSPSGRTAC